ncbi:DUF2273 domain-containing protein [Enterococcus villorum]|jgi:uncharacterized membrane protein|uniref:DUF2273 domain-containing protein n=2 Tax=Enterococcus villorum TaxID=112904 RepID=A0A1V8YFZ0_9ENTE|nr:DUF2273 domain-containing protein [Enterococcus villorum]EOH90782.1 hypothetical protein UAO_00961 [Enterococcus villorum ATCC 700913]EOW77949.1 hypothetical protein I591_00804 [Enterococcus villorum ATCC 700913]OQO71492.1 DUF2273 domain-containing protein [Enterococcus villorum]OQO76667.1 DUF2273 domain-containing protein [Enterococcus villorum]GEL90669.1 DUF2273 domain-containing protein [Enterococcus villorum]
MKELFSAYKLPIIFGGLGLLLAILWITVGFFKTLLLLIMTAIGIGIGFYLKETKMLDHYFKS